MKKEQYIDQIKSIHSLYNKLEELVNISRLPITIESFNLKYNLMDMKRVGNTYYYRKDSKSVFVFLEGRIARLAYFDEDSAEIYEVDLEHANTFKQYTYRDGKVTEISINSKCLSITSSNNITNDFKALLNSLSVKFNINYNKQVEYCSFEFELPKLIEEEKIIKEPIPYIPKCKAVIIDKNIGRVLSSTKDKYSMNYQETRFKLTPNIFRNDILPRFAVTNRENIVDTNNSRPKNIDDIVIFVSPLRQYKVKSLTEKILLNPNKENFNSFLLRYYDEIIQALQYFQNEDINKFYVFENELNRLQLK